MRKVFRFLAFIFAVALTHTGLAGAKTIEEVLKEKGVITEAEYKEATASRPTAYVPGKGFTFTSPEKNFQLTLGGRGQFFYQFLDKDTARTSASSGSGASRCTWAATRLPATSRTACRRT